MNKADFGNNVTSFNRRITSNETKYLKVQKKLNSLIAKDGNVILGRMYLTSNEGSQNRLVYQRTL